MGLKSTNAYDPDNAFDPTQRGSFNNADGPSGAATQVVSAKPGQKMTVSLSMKNNGVVTLPFELFNWMNSFTKILNPVYATGAYAMIPLLSYEGLAIGTPFSGTVGFDQAGNVQIRGNEGAANGRGVIACSTTPYRAFFEASSIIPFSVTFIRMTFTSDPQIDQELTWFQKTFAGAISQNKTNPRDYFKPQQFQDLIVDVTASFPVGIDAGVSLNVLPGENLRYSIFISYWTKQVI